MRGVCEWCEVRNGGGVAVLTHYGWWAGVYLGTCFIDKRDQVIESN